uniref:Putative secreted peptide n=1 Tax=Anopheles braziliensis TaxID=58242 RepID=A0A2M3ZSP7_9DIPT
MLLLLVLLLQLTTIPNDARCVMMVTEHHPASSRYRTTVRCCGGGLMIHWFVFDFHLHGRTARRRQCVKLVQFPARSRRIVLRSTRYILILNLPLEQYVATVSPDDYRFTRDGKIVQHIVLETRNPRNNTATTTVGSITGRTTFTTTVRVVTVRQCTGGTCKRGHHSTAGDHHHSAHRVGIVYGGRITAHGNATYFGGFQARSEMPWPIVGVFARLTARRTLPAVR